MTFILSRYFFFNNLCRKSFLQVICTSLIILNISKKRKNELESWAWDLVSVLYTPAALCSGDPSQVEGLAQRRPEKPWLDAFPLSAAGANIGSDGTPCPGMSLFREQSWCPGKHGFCLKLAIGWALNLLIQKPHANISRDFSGYKRPEQTCFSLNPTQY